MGNSDLGACEWFLWDLRRSNLLDRGHLDQIVSTFLEKNPRAEPPQLAQFLIEQEILTQFQADRLLQGKTQGFVLGPISSWMPWAPEAWERSIGLNPKPMANGTP